MHLFIYILNRALLFISICVQSKDKPSSYYRYVKFIFDVPDPISLSSSFLYQSYKLLDNFEEENASLCPTPSIATKVLLDDNEEGRVVMYNRSNNMHTVKVKKLGGTALIDVNCLIQPCVIIGMINWSN